MREYLKKRKIMNKVRTLKKKGTVAVSNNKIMIEKMMMMMMKMKMFKVAITILAAKILKVNNKLNNKVILVYINILMISCY